MDLMTALGEVPALAPYLTYIATFGFICAVVATKLAPPTTAGWYARVYATVNWIGRNVGHARNATAPVKAPVADPHASIASPDHSKL